LGPELSDDQLCDTAVHEGGHAVLIDFLGGTLLRVEIYPRLTDGRLGHALSPWVMQWVAELATRMSFKAAQMMCKAVLLWAPATEAIEQVVFGMGGDAASFMQQLQPPQQDRVMRGALLILAICCVSLTGCGTETLVNFYLLPLQRPEREIHQEQPPS
jgi:hypothetical protein